MTLSVMSLLDMNALCVRCMISDRIGFNLLAIALNIIL